MFVYGPVTLAEYQLTLTLDVTLKSCQCVRTLTREQMKLRTYNLAERSCLVACIRHLQVEGWLWHILAL